MKKIININLSGRVIPIEDSAYESLQRYIESLRRYFANEEGRDEIINDIESRIAELMNDKVRKGAAAITDTDVEEIIHAMGRVEDFEQEDAEALGATTAATSGSQERTYSQSTESKYFSGRLYRDASDKMIGGVCSGLANYLNVDPAIVRLLFAIITFGGFGMGFLIYILMWIILPAKDLNEYTGKRLFRNPDDRIVAGVAGGLGAYFNIRPTTIRLILLAPVLINIFFVILRIIFTPFHQYGNFPVSIATGSITGTFILAYVILWIVLPMARTPYDKMEMRGEKVDVNRIKQNVQEGMSDFKARMQAWGEEVKTSAQDLGERARTFANTRGKEFAGEVQQVARPAANGLAHAIGVILRVFLLIVAGSIAFGLFIALIVLIFGGIAWWPVNNFLWSSNWQKVLAFSTLLLFIAVPVIAFFTWLIRRLLQVRTRNHYLGLTFVSLWIIGVISAVAFGASVASDIRSYERVATDVPVAQPLHNKMIVAVSEPEIHFTGNAWWMDNNNSGFDVNSDTMRYNNVKLRVVKSDDSAYHTTIYKYSAGSNAAEARERAQQTQFSVFSQDSVLNIGSGLAISKNAKFRGQGVILEIQVPVGKQIRFDQSVEDTYNSWVVRKYERRYSSNRWRRQYKVDWDMDDYFDWNVNTDYVMTKEGQLVAANTLNVTPGAFAPESDSLQRIRDEQKRVRDSIDNELKKTEQQMNRQKRGMTGVSEETTFIHMPYFTVII